MYIRMTRSKRSKHPTMQIVQGVREGKKVKQRIVASLGVVRDQKDQKRLERLAKNLIRRLQEEGCEQAKKWINIENLKHRETVHDGFALAVERLMELTGISRILKSHEGKQTFDLNEIATMLLAQHFDTPSSKRRSVLWQENHGFADIGLHHVYRAMDCLIELKDDIQKQAFQAAHGELFEDPVDCFFFDVTTLYFESVQEDELRSFGYSKDQKYHCVQVVYCLVVNKEGIPLAYEVYKGNTAEVKTLVEVMDKLKTRFTVASVTVVCDRAMGSKGNLQALHDAGYSFVVACKLRQLPKKFAINDLSKCDPFQEYSPEETDQTYIRTLEHPFISDSELIITYNTRRAKKDKNDRERMLDKLSSALKPGQESSVKKVISNSAYKKFTKTKPGSEVTLNENAIKEDASWDGFHGLVVSKSAKLSPKTALQRYRNLWRIEEAFRVTKNFFEARPMFHRMPSRIQSHLLICFIALFLERVLELLLRRHGTLLTPDRIRKALKDMHYVEFEDYSSKQTCKMQSCLSEDMLNICEVIGIDKTRTTALV